MSEILSVSEITGLVKQTLEDEFDEVSVIGEISNFKAHVSGHWYFTLKDSNAQINCTMWRGLNSYVFFSPKDGMKIIANGKITVYPPRGSYQLDVRSMKPAGVGELQAAFEKLKQKLFEEGLFDEENKKPIPRFPQKIGVVTAIDGAAFQDMKSISSRRYPLAELVIASCRVQGEGAAEEIVKSIKLLNQQNDIDVIVVGRGGGSLEDLWAFNEEIVARAIFASKIPVISAVGHEVDFTISDFVADLRAATPSAAIELATPNKDDLFGYISEFSYYNSQKMFEILRSCRDEVTSHITSYGFRMPQDFIRNKTQYLDSVLYKFSNLADNKIVSGKTRIDLLESKINAMSVDSVLKRGFSYIKQNERVIARMKNFTTEESFLIKFYDGEVKIDGKEERK
ncbi:MAG: exodeoxyribonuclease VII large subunit [Stygiobacter sp. RIFOXYC12_FULL_38_8]|nr:MAG: exodeoxyribonuclease VII large subunit [Stygiobacter sp. GWC2_38_9]OGU77275.1 MAG: exodeoxyribonuclease VII large subunit [Stygiobacter sp. RIFOXYA12_FULL_38_9]OGV08998.1 MAG: exodeoxyribonuclease VII large subunit [Stygiobacter sp. RIFOXYB2_FULL_37_11]OGV14185.1 MAG: exodeoxyribonuclease VII large subunit [Stygiobacter sp. RIFOXYA2_FULL_38_8]OGV16222.1 MAG: exodeoxyribonuclease VII large subunit [Stygiobacter sp. RIFOXYC2_FULL_38_25]OGV25639.1 MAG: exodeoxyribonuclease VII large subun